jgi:hypothetical protein
MEFFNKKEDVIDLQLTQFGRHLLSKGKFNPAYYSFFDDNIIYDISKTSGHEGQNRSEERIKEAQNIQPQIGFSSLEKEFGNNYNLVLSGDATSGDLSLQRTPEKNYMLPSPLGTSDFNAEYAPSWNIQFLNGHISSSAKYINLTEKTGGTNTVRIPQLQSDLEIKVINIEGGTEDIEDLEEYEDGPLSNVYIENEESVYILLKIAESNGLFQKKNFDIEMFEVQEENQAGTIIEHLRPLKFSESPEITSQLDFLDDETPEANKEHVEYYFDILTDDEIDDEILCEKDPEDEKQQKLGVFSDPRAKLCQDILNQQKKKVFDIYEDESDYPGEIC